MKLYTRAQMARELKISRATCYQKFDYRVRYGRLIEGEHYYIIED
jgi:hypothetical protein